MGDEDQSDDVVLQPGMSGSIVSSTAMFALAHGVSADELAAATGLSVDQLILPDRRQANDIAAKIWLTVLARDPQGGLPLKMARAVPHNFFGSLAFGAQYAESLRESLVVFTRYRRVLSDELDVELIESGDEAAFRFRHVHDDLDAGAGAEVGLGLGVRFTREIIGVEALVRVVLNHAPHGPMSDYEGFFTVPVEFEGGGNALVFDRASLDRPTPGGDTKLFEYIQRHLDNARAQLVVDDGLGEVREAIADNAQRSEWGAEALAKRMGMSLRVLQRQVAGHETTVRELLEEARERYARELLEDRRSSVEEVAFVLGYSNERAFRRAYKRMTGMTPAQYRKQS